MKKIFDSCKRYHGYKTQYDYYATSMVMDKFYSGKPLNVNDRINIRSMYDRPTVIDAYIDKL